MHIMLWTSPPLLTQPPWFRGSRIIITTTNVCMLGVVGHVWKGRSLERTDSFRSVWVFDPEKHSRGVPGLVPKRLLCWTCRLLFLLRVTFFKHNKNPRILKLHQLETNKYWNPPVRFVYEMGEIDRSVNIVCFSLQRNWGSRSRVNSVCIKPVCRTCGCASLCV